VDTHLGTFKSWIAKLVILAIIPPIIPREAFSHDKKGFNFLGQYLEMANHEHARRMG
jgi:hypothetical protein